MSEQWRESIEQAVREAHCAYDSTGNSFEEIVLSRVLPVVEALIAERDDLIGELERAADAGAKRSAAIVFESVTVTMTTAEFDIVLVGLGFATMYGLPLAEPLHAKLTRAKRAFYRDLLAAETNQHRGG